MFDTTTNETEYTEPPCPAAFPWMTDFLTGAKVKAPKWAGASTIYADKMARRDRIDLELLSDLDAEEIVTTGVASEVLGFSNAQYFRDLAARIGLTPTQSKKGPRCLLWRGADVLAVADHVSPTWRSWAPRRAAA